MLKLSQSIREQIEGEYPQTSAQVCAAVEAIMAADASGLNKLTNIYSDKVQRAIRINEGKTCNAGQALSAFREVSLRMVANEALQRVNRRAGNGWYNPLIASL